MIRRIPAWKNFGDSTLGSKVWLDRFWLVALLLVSVVLFSINLGQLPLRDWDEGTVAQVARDIWRSPPGSLTWLHPTIAGQPYLSKPPLVHWLIANLYSIGGVNEWTSRLPGAMLTAMSVPVLYSIGRELFPNRTPAVFAALVYLTFLPVVRNGRLAMLDGAVLCFFLLLVLCLLRTRRDLRWGLGVGVAFGLLCLTKGIVALLLGAIAVIFILLDTPRLLTSVYVWIGLLLGSLPAALWYGAQWRRYGWDFITINVQVQSFNRIWAVVESNSGPPWYYVLEILKYGVPWILFLPWAVQFAWEHRNLGWAKLVLVWSIVFLVVISVMGTKLPWYVLPIYPAFALMVGVQLANVWNPADLMGIRRIEKQHFPTAWTVLFSIVSIAGWAGSFYFSPLGSQVRLDLHFLLTTVALLFTVTTVLLVRQDSQFILVLLWGTYLSLLLFVSSHYWVWELNEAYPVKPVAALIQRQTPPGTVIATSFPLHRPSLNFYSDRLVIPMSPEVIQKNWNTPPNDYVLLDQKTLKQLPLERARSLGKAGDWTLLTQDQ